MTEFNPINAQREELLGLQDIHKLLIVSARDTEVTLAEAEAKHNATIKLERFVADLVKRAQMKLRTLEEEAEKKKT